jgi:hypothetical protein
MWSVVGHCRALTWPHRSSWPRDGRVICNTRPTGEAKTDVVVAGGVVAGAAVVGGDVEGASCADASGADVGVIICMVAV